MVCGELDLLEGSVEVAEQLLPRRGFLTDEIGAPDPN